jgi:hypothetical protein
MICLVMTTRNEKPTQDQVKKAILEAAAAREKALAPAMEVVEHIHRALMAMPLFTLSDGTKGCIEPYVSPEIDKDGDASCSIDVILSNGSHLEFKLKNTGWGKAFAPQIRQQMAKQVESRSKERQR